MVKSLEPQTNKSSPRLKLPINLIIFWYKRLSNIINSKKFEATNKDNCPKIYKYYFYNLLNTYLF